MHSMQHIAESEIYGGLRCDKVQCGFLLLSACERGGKNNQNMKNWFGRILLPRPFDSPEVGLMGDRYSSPPSPFLDNFLLADNSPTVDSSSSTCAVYNCAHACL